MPVRIGCVVEGHGEVDAVPALIRRIANQREVPPALVIPRPVRVTRSRLLRDGELEKAVSLAALHAGTGGGILILIDADDDCPAELGPRLLQRARAARSDMPTSVVLAKTEFESWFLASAASMCAAGRLPPNIDPPSEPEAIRGAKEWLVRVRGSYRSGVDQATLVHHIDLEQARRAPSFDKLFREVSRLLDILAV
jgi:Domain of unknown function (DUF4276)